MLSTWYKVFLEKLIVTRLFNLFCAVTPWRRFFLEKLVILQLLQIFSAVCGIWKSIAMLTTARIVPLNRAR